MSKFNNEYVKGVLKTKGTRFVNGEGQEIILNGYGTPNWQNVEGFMIGGELKDFSFNLFPGPGRDHNPERFTSRRYVSQTVRELCGSKYLETFWDRVAEAHMGEADIKLMADVGFNVVRLVLNANALLDEEPGIRWNETSFAHLTKIMDWCEKYKIYAILDMHAPVGGNNGATGDGLFCEVPNVFVDAESRERTILLWEELARRYSDRWILAGYDLINEPVSSPVQDEYIPMLKQYYLDCIARMRKIDKEHIFFLEGSKYARDNRIFDCEYDPGYHNWAMSIHLYGASPEIKDLYPFLLKCREWDIPLWLGECGAGPLSNSVFFDICAHYGIAYTPWGFKTAYDPAKAAQFGGRKPGSVGHPLPEGWNKITEYMLGGPRPSYEECQKIFDQYIENMKLEHCMINYEGYAMSKKHPDIDVPGVAYDMFLEDGSRYYGTWEMSNYLDFRLEDHTKLVWATTKYYPYPAFTHYRDPHVLRYDPLTDLALELGAGEFANYTVREVTKPCTVTLSAAAPAGATVTATVNGESIGVFTVPVHGDIINPVDSNTLTIPAGEEVVVKLTVNEGPVQIKAVKFHY